MFFKSIKAALGAALLSLSAGAASAAVIDFTVAGSVTPIGTQTGSFSMGTVTASAGCTPLCPPVITQLPSGLGVSAHQGDDPAIDGALLWESLTFDFDKKVKLKNITFGDWDNEDDFVLTVDGGTFSASGDSGTFSFGSGLVGQSITVFAYDAFEIDNPCATTFMGFICVPSGGPDDFTVSSIEVSAVPLPAAGWLLFGGIGGLAALRRRKKAA